MNGSIVVRVIDVRSVLAEVMSHAAEKTIIGLGYERVGTHKANASYPELDGLPTFKGLPGPFPDAGGARYDTPKAFEMLST